MAVSGKVFLVISFILGFLGGAGLIVGGYFIANDANSSLDGTSTLTNQFFSLGGRINDDVFYCGDIRLRVTPDNLNQNTENCNLAYEQMDRGWFERVHDICSNDAVKVEYSDTKMCTLKGYEYVMAMFMACGSGFIIAAFLALIAGINGSQTLALISVSIYSAFYVVFLILFALIWRDVSDFNGQCLDKTCKDVSERGKTSSEQLLIVGICTIVLIAVLIVFTVVGALNSVDPATVTPIVGSGTETNRSGMKGTHLQSVRTIPPENENEEDEEEDDDEEEDEEDNEDEEKETPKEEEKETPKEEVPKEQEVPKKKKASKKEEVAKKEEILKKEEVKEELVEKPIMDKTGKLGDETQIKEPTPKKAIAVSEAGKEYLKKFQLLNKYIADKDKMQKYADKKFKQTDKDNSGTINIKEFREFVVGLMTKKNLPAPSDNNIRELMYRYDADESGVLDKKEFKQMLLEIFLSSREILIVKYAGKKANSWKPDKVPEDKDLSMIVELEELLKDNTKFYMELEKLAESVDRNNNGMLDINEVTEMMNVFCKRYNVPVLTQDEITEVMHDMERDIIEYDVYDFRMVAFAVLNISRCLLM